MVELNKISKVGFGGYRVSYNVRENYLALSDALKYGCNLIDTASNYTDGESEKLIGKVLQENRDKDVFLITKGGYISGKNLINFKKLNKKGLGLANKVNISNNFIHSIHPEYLQEQINVSLNRLSRTHLDGFLLHSPEYYFDGQDGIISENEYYARFRLAFEFLEEKVKQGTIRYYGVSSNSFIINNNEKKFTNLEKLIECSKNVSSNNHFKLIQFPFNICEQGASLPQTHNKLSLLEIARKNNLITFGNRPLNANSENGMIKLVLYHPHLNDEANSEIYLKCMNLIQTKLKEKFDDDDYSTISVLAFLDNNWMSIEREDVFKKVFDDMFFPFLSFIYDENIPGDDLNLFKELENIAWKYHLRAASLKTINYLKTNHLESFLNNKKSLPYNLIENYLETGVDHILTGMKRPAYVKEFQNLFYT